MHTVLLQYLDEIARQGSIRKASVVLNVSSTAVNRKIINLEQRLGVKLFERTSTGVEPSAAGKIVLEHCRKTTYEFDKIKGLLNDIRDLKTGHLNIQTIDSLTFDVLPRIMLRFNEKLPGVSMAITTATSENVTQSVLSGEADIGISFTKDVHPDIRVLNEKSAPFGLILRPDHPLAERAHIGVDEIAGYPLVRTIDARGEHSLLDQELASLGTSLSAHLFTNAMVVAKKTILANQGIGIYTKIGFLEEIQAEKLKFIPFSAPMLRDYKVGFVMSASSNMDPLKRLFFDATDHVLKHLSFDY